VPIISGQYYFNLKFDVNLVARLMKMGLEKIFGFGKYYKILN
jgi:hypothetical protein